MAIILHCFSLLTQMILVVCGQLDLDFLRTEISATSEATLAANLEVSTRSKLDCARTCMEDLACSAFGYNKRQKVCYVFNDHLNENVTVDISSEIEHATFYNLSFCQNGGKRQGNYCDCFQGYVGLHCERLMSDCSDGFNEGIRETGVYQIKPTTAPIPFQVKCLMNRTGQTVVQWHHNSSFSFNRTWAEFRTGFGNRASDHWIGNEKLFWLTQSREFALRVSVKSQWGDTHNFDVLWFTVQSENSSYAISYHDTQGPENCLSRYNGSAFSTFDRGNSSNCAALNGSGWWYDFNCSECNLNGRLYKENASNITGPAIWIAVSEKTIEHIRQAEMTLVLMGEITNATQVNTQGVGFTTPIQPQAT